jgi:hypothetical protein
MNKTIRFKRGRRGLAFIQKPLRVGRGQPLVGISWRIGCRAEARTTTARPEDFRQVQGMDWLHTASEKRSN